ncbi:MAG TPA: DUF2066 domain-containing protein, partial [Stellaceae bacterium]|nr:DUF2066 domain-containing protein [Stellaceae bacterium]
LAGLILLVAHAGPARQATAAAASDIFTVADVPVDATAANAVAARDAARLDGERRAFRQLLERLTLVADRGRLPRVGDQQLTDMVRDFEVANERSSGIRYLATYTFRFRPETVRALLRDAGIPFAETVSKPVVVLPVLRRDDAAVLWDDPNPWRAAWSDRTGSSGLVPLVVPLGDAEDVAAIGPDQALAADPAALTRIAAHNGGGDILIAAATQRSGGELQTSLRRVSASGTSEIAKASFQPAPGESDSAFMARAVAASVADVEEGWRRDNVLATGKEGVLTAAVPLNGGLAEWLVVRDRLRGVPTVKRSDVLTLGRQAARIEIHYLGDPARLRVALAQRDLVLDGGEDSWTLRPRSGAARPPGDPPR